MCLKFVCFPHQPHLHHPEDGYWHLNPTNPYLLLPDDWKSKIHHSPCCPLTWLLPFNFHPNQPGLLIDFPHFFDVSSFSLPFLCN